MTYQKRGTGHIVREKPIPRDPYSLNQAYQRWDYRDYAYLWTLESEADKQTYRTRASRYHITGFSLWMREHLLDLPLMLGRWHLDERSGAVAYDSSKNTNNGTILGPTPAAGLIAGGYSFDGINDRINCGNDPSLDIALEDFTIIAFINCPVVPNNPNPIIVARGTTGATEWMWRLLRVTGFLNFRSPGGAFLASGLTNLKDAAYHAVAFTKSGDTWYIYIDDFIDNTGVGIGAVDLTTTANLTISSNVALRRWHSLIDEVILFKRHLPLAEFQLFSERRYPL